MSDVIHVASARSAHGTTVTKLIQQPPDRSHVVQFYEDASNLYETVGRFLEAGFAAGDRLLVVVSAAHRAGILERFGMQNVQQGISSGQLTVLDAEETLAQLLVDGMPDTERFRKLLHGFIEPVASTPGKWGRIRAFGEMVNVLWRSGNARAAIRLEELWSEAGERYEFSLLCAYVMGNFYREIDTVDFLEVCRNHSHIIPSETFGEFDDPHARLREISYLQQRAQALESEVQQRKKLELALREALRERARDQEELRDALRREHAARIHAERNDAFKELFLGILGHDLRNPLNTVLTTARLMLMRGGLPDENLRWIGRIETSGARMQRMIEQILDVTRDRLAAGIPVTRGPEQDLLPLVARIVDEIRVAHPTRIVVLEATGPCNARVDADRLEQVVSNLLGNAVSHGDPACPIRVSVSLREAVVNLSVHNYGPAIDPETMRVLFDPFSRPNKPARASAGLGLGLYISERIVEAHGGRIAVTSSAEQGTQFDVRFPGQST